jgi:flavin reductase (DIM6/NTAB) family NADH-FMN oxidoreductase RutF
MHSLIKKLFFNNATIKTFYITRLLESQIQEKVILKNGKRDIDISSRHGMICLDPFCIGVWLPQNDAVSINSKDVEIEFTKGTKLNATIELSLIEKIPTPQGELLLYKIEKVKNHQSSALHRLLLLSYLLKSKNNTYYHRRVVSALYSYPRSIIIVSYRDDKYYNVFPMDIHAYLKEEGMYILGLRTTNITLDKILEAKKVVVCDTDHVDIKTVYDLGKHSSTDPTPIEEMPFKVTESELFHFYVPEFVGTYKEIEIIHHKKMGYHMLLVGKIVNHKVIDQNASSLYHLGFLEYHKGNYPSIDGIF